MDLDTIMKAVDPVLILAIMGITEILKRYSPESWWRFTPVIVLALGGIAGWITAPATEIRAIIKGVIIYGGGSSIAYELLRTTVFGKGAKAEK